VKEKDMAKEKAWYADSAVGTLLADLFEGKWSPELLAQLAQIPLAEAERGAFPGCPPSSGRKRRFRLVERVQAHKEACSFLLARPSGSGIESFLRLSADGEELGALETMLGLGLSRMNTLRPAGINLVLRLVHRSLLGVGLRGLNADGAKRYRRLCRDVHPLIVCSGSNTPSLARLFFRARGLAVKFGDRRDMALFDLLVGSINACKPDFCGDHVLTPEQIAELIAKYHCQGVPVAFHANGDAAIEFVVRGFEEALRKCPRKVPGDMIIHVQMATDEQLSRLHACGVTPTFFVRHVNVWGERHVNLFLGEERAARLDPCGSCVRMGIPFGLHVDSPVQPVDAIRSIHTAVNRTTTAGRILGPDQRISPLDALKAYTVNAAKCSARDHAVGTIAPGYYADFVQLSGNPLTVPPESIETLSVLKTISGGRIVYES
jgi:hypothetical protein